MIFDYWKFLMSDPQDSVEWGLKAGEEGLFWYDGNNADFWYLLNVRWYEMNNKLLARTDCKEPYDPNLRNFDEDCLIRKRFK